MTLVDTRVTAAEERVNELLGQVMTEFAALPEEHPSDVEEFARGIHVLQNIVLARAGLRSIRWRQRAT